MENNKCKRCGRELKNEKAIELGHGLTCAKKLGLIVKPIILVSNDEDLDKWNI